MPRTTLNLDAAVLRELRRLQRTDERPLGDIVSSLLAEALRRPTAEPAPFRWIAQPLGVKVDLEDRDEVERLLALEDAQAAGEGNHAS